MRLRGTCRSYPHWRAPAPGSRRRSTARRPGSPGRAESGEQLLIHREGHPEIGSADRRHAAEALAGDADHREVVAVESDGLADEVAIATKSPLPESVGQHRHGMFAEPLIFFRTEGASGGNRRAQHIEKV